jgi:hypothetical protein
MQVIYLKTSTSALHFGIQGNGWTKVYLESNKKSIELGAEVNYILFRKIRDFLNRKDLETLAGTIENIAVTHVVSLSEKTPPCMRQPIYKNQCCFSRTQREKFLPR